MTPAPGPQAMTPTTASDSVGNRPPLGVAQTTMVHTMSFPEASSKYRRGVGMEYRDCDGILRKEERLTNAVSPPDVGIKSECLCMRQ